MGRVYSNTRLFILVGQVVQMRRTLIPVLLAASTAVAQDDFDRVLQLARARQKTTQSLTHLPDYTCVATAQRSVQKAGHASFKVVDTLRYEIAQAGGTELGAGQAHRNSRTNRSSL